jgi:hypothetical protein
MAAGAEFSNAGDSVYGLRHLCIHRFPIANAIAGEKSTFSSMLEPDKMKSKQKIWWALLAGAICFAALLLAVFGSDWAIGYVFRR